MNRIVEILEKYASGKKVLGLFILTNVVYLYMLLVTIPKKIRGFSNGMKLFDLMPTGYNLNYVNGVFHSLGENGRES